MMDIRKLMFLKAASGKKDENLLDYSDLVNKSYGGDASDYNVRPENKIAVTPGKPMVMECDLKVSEFNIRFYGETGTYQSSYTISKYGSSTKKVEFTVPEDSYFILPKWNRSGDALLVAELVENNPVIKYA